MEITDQRLEDWLSQVCESPKTRGMYLFVWGNFEKFCRRRGKDPLTLVDDFRAVKYQGELQKERFLEEWQDVLRAFNTWLKPKFAPLTVKNHLTGVRSFLNYWKIPLGVDLPKHACVIWHNRDIKKEEVKQILTFATARDRVIWLVMAESGMRSDNAVNLRYSQIKEDFEAKRVPMKILLPSNTLKDHVGDRFTFIGEDGFRELSGYLQRRLPLQDNNFVFVTEKQGRVKGEQFTPGSLSMKFNNIVQKLGIDKSVTGKLNKDKGERPKPKQIRLHGLRKYFRNNMKADSAFINFWMGHSLGVDQHYISRDPEGHRKEYANGYQHLRIFEASEEVSKHYVTLGQFESMLKMKDAEVAALRAELERYMKGAEGFEKRLQEVKTEMRREFEMMVGPKTLNELKELLESRKRLLKKLPPKYVAKE